MMSLKLYKSSILQLFFLLISLLFIYIEYYNISIVISILVLIIIHHISRTKFTDESKVFSNPLIILIPIFIITQSLFWFIYLLNENDITFFNYSWEIPYMMDISFLPISYSIFLFLSSVYLYALSLSYNQKINYKLRPRNFELSNNSFLYFILSILVIISILFYIFGDNISMPIGIAHFFKILSKLRIVFSAIIIFHLINKRTITAKFSLLIFLIIYIALGFLSVIVFSMRMILFEPLILILIIFLINKKRKRINILKLFKLSLFLSVCFFIFSIANSLKFADYPNNTNYSVPQTIIHSLDVFSSRSAAYFPDIIAYTNSASKNLFQKKGYYNFTEIIYGLPLGSVIVPKKYSYKYPFDMEFFWTYCSNCGTSSTYVSAPSALMFTVGIPITILILFFVGLFQGYIFKYITFKLGSEHSWFIIHPILVPFYLNGLAKGDILGFLAYSFIAYWILKHIILKKTKTQGLNIYS